MITGVCFEDLATELHYYTLKFLGAKDLCNVRLLGSYWKYLADSDSLWRKIVRRYNIQATIPKSQEINYKELYKEIQWLGFDNNACGSQIQISDDNMAAVKQEDHKYATVLGRRGLTARTAERYYWEVYITNMQISGCLCIGVVNTKDAINHPSESHGMFGHYNHGWGLFSDGERCHNATWYRPPCSPFSNNDRVGVLVEFHPPTPTQQPITRNDDELKGKATTVSKVEPVMKEEIDDYVARIEFFVNGVPQGTAFDEIKGPLYPAFAIKRKSEGIRMNPEATIRFCINEQKRVRTNSSVTEKNSQKLSLSTAQSTEPVVIA